MNPKDKTQLQNWITSGDSCDTVLRAPRFGLVGNERFTEQTRRAFLYLWAWSAPRFEGSVGAAQDRVYKRGGQAALDRRYARIGRIIANIKTGNF